MHSPVRLAEAGSAALAGGRSAALAGGHAALAGGHAALAGGLAGGQTITHNVADAIKGSVTVGAGLIETGAGRRVRSLELRGSLTAVLAFHP